MKSSIKITCCGVISALAVVVMLVTNVPVMLYTVPALAGMLFMIPAIEFGTKWGFLCYGITAVLSLIMPTEREALVMFIGILGYYSILKMVIERYVNRFVGYVIKFAVFNAAVVASYFVITKFLGIPAFDNDRFGVVATVSFLLVIGNIAFGIFDFALTRMLQLYFIKLRKQARRMLGLKGKY